jgi:hypothetical protein
MPPVRRASSRNVQRTILQDDDEIRSPRLDKNLVLAGFLHGIFGKKKIDEIIPGTGKWSFTTSGSLQYMRWR